MNYICLLLSGWVSVFEFNLKGKHLNNVNRTGIEGVRALFLVLQTVFGNSSIVYIIFMNVEETRSPYSSTSLWRQHALWLRHEQFSTHIMNAGIFFPDNLASMPRYLPVSPVLAAVSKFIMGSFSLLYDISLFVKCLTVETTCTLSMTWAAVLPHAPTPRLMILLSVCNHGRLDVLVMRDMCSVVTNVCQRVSVDALKMACTSRCVFFMCLCILEILLLNVLYLIPAKTATQC